MIDDPFERYRSDRSVETRNEIVESNLALARGFARRYDHRGVALEDLEQVATIALIRAVERFDPEIGVKFATYASRTIDGELKRHFRDRAWSVKVPRRSQELGPAVRAAIEELTKAAGRAPTAPEVAERVGAEVDEVLAAIEAAQAYRADSLDVPGQGETGAAVVDRLGGVDDALEQIETRDTVSDLLGRLDERERRIVELRFFGERSQRQIADEMGISQMHVSRLLRRALDTLRAATDR